MKTIISLIKNPKGIIMVIAIVILLSITAVGIGMIINTSMSTTIAKNYVNKLQSFYASDGQMTLLAQEVIDKKESLYLSAGQVGNPKYKILANRDNKYVILSSNTLRATGTDSASAETFEKIPAGSNFKLRAVSNGMYVKFRAGDTLEATGTEAEAMIFSFPACEASPGDGGIAIYAVNDDDANKYTCAADPVRNLVARSGSCSGWERFFFKQVGDGGGGATEDSIWPISVQSFGEQQTGNEAVKSIDNNVTTRWGTNNNLANCWIIYNLGTSNTVSGVKIMFERANVTYPIKIEVDGQEVFSGNASVGAVGQYWSKTFTTPKSGSTAKVTLTALTSANDAWFSFFEIRFIKKIYPIPDTVRINNFLVKWKITPKPNCPLCFDIYTKAFTTNVKWDTIFQTPLKQYIERQGEITLTYPDTVWLKALFWDYHYDLSNPEFEPYHVRMDDWVGIAPSNICSPNDDQYYNYCNGVCPYSFCECLAENLRPDSIRKQMVLSTLTETDTLYAGYFGLPFLYKPSPATNPARWYWSKNLSRWFRPWYPTGGVIPRYDTLGKYLGDVAGPDTAFKNKAILDSLPFIRIAGGIYQFERNDASGKPFFWLDTLPNTLGLDTVGIKNRLSDPSVACLWSSMRNCKGHNLAFTMELHAMFTYEPGLTFDFIGDDDVWVFINKQLVIDLGGIHYNKAASVNLDLLPGMIQNKRYSFDFFYAERHHCSSNCKITTNIKFFKTVTQQRHWRRDYGSLE